MSPTKKSLSGSEQLRLVYLMVVQTTNRGFTEEELRQQINQPETKRRTINHILDLALAEGVPFYSDGLRYWVSKRDALIHRLDPPPSNVEINVQGRRPNKQHDCLTSHETMWSSLDIIRAAEAVRPITLTRVEQYNLARLRHPLLASWWPGRGEWVFTLPLLFEAYQDLAPRGLCSDISVERKDKKSVIREYLDYKLDPYRLGCFLLQTSYKDNVGYRQLVVDAVHCSRYIYWDLQDSGTRAVRRWNEYMTLSEIFAARHFKKLCSGIPFDTTTLTAQVLQIKACMQ